MKLTEEVKLQKRHFLLISKNKEDNFVKSIQKSPLELAEKLIIMLNENNFAQLVEQLDDIKQFVGGIERTSKLSKYKLAEYYSTMFAFHQFFNSSFRARQGKVLETIIQEIIKKFIRNTNVPKKPKEMKKIIQEIYDYETKLDIDVLALNPTKKKVIIIQLRSRDDTGGTTAKGSLVDFLRDLLRKELVNSEYDLTYLIAVWDKRNSQQKKSTVNKMFDSLKDVIKIKEEKFRQNISTGVKISAKITLKLAYGTNEISQAIYNWDNTKNQKILKSIKKIVNRISSWDDLWLAYAIGNLEMEKLAFSEKSNMEILNNYLEKEKIQFDKITSKQIDNIALKIASVWKEETLPFSSPFDQIHYIRDLLYLKLIYLKIKK